MKGSGTCAKCGLEVPHGVTVMVNVNKGTIEHPFECTTQYGRILALRLIEQAEERD